MFLIPTRWLMKKMAAPSNMQRIKGWNYRRPFVKPTFPESSQEDIRPGSSPTPQACSERQDWWIGSIGSSAPFWCPTCFGVPKQATILYQTDICSMSCALFRDSVLLLVSRKNSSPRQFVHQEGQRVKGKRQCSDHEPRPNACTKLVTSHDLSH